MNNSEGALIGISKFAPFIAHSVGDIDTFPIISDCPIVAIHVVDPGPFKKSWHQGTLAAGEVKGFQISEKLWRVIVCDVASNPQNLDNVLSRARKLDALVYMQNGPHLRSVEQRIRDKSKELNSVIILLNKPVNKASRGHSAQ